MATRPDEAAVGRYLRRLRQRAGAVYAVRTLAASTGAGLLAFALVALVVGPVVSLPWAIAGWALVVAAAAAGAWAALRPAQQLRGARVAGLLQRVGPELASQARSVVELERDARAADLAPELVHAHAAQVRSALAHVRPARVVPWSTLRHATTFGGLGAGALALVAMLATDAAPSGAWAMLHPDTRDDEGITLAAVVDATEAHLTYPAYMGRKPKTLFDPIGIEAPKGTSVRYELQPRIDAEEAVLKVAGRDVRMSKEADGRFVSRFVLREGGALGIQVRRPDGAWLADPTRRWLRAVKDGTPRVVLEAPESDRVVELEQPVDVAWDASDDVALRELELVVRTPAGRDERRSLARWEQDEPRMKATGKTEVIAIDFGARPGDRLQVWVEARDGDVVSGPNVGKSSKRTLTVASEATRRLEAIAELEGVLGRGLDALADRLEEPVPERARATERFELVSKSTDRFVAGLRELSRERKGGEPGGPQDGSLYREMAGRVDRLAGKEARAHGDRPSTTKRRERLDAALVTELEKDVLLLSDLVGRSRLEDAAAITRELEKLRREMASLLAELKRAETPEARRAIMAALSRAEARLQELMRRMAQMGEDVPSEFVNADALPQQESKDALSSMREALERGDLDEAEKQLMELEHRIRSIADALGNAESDFAEARFGPRQKAMAEALDKLAGLETEQRQLAERSEQVRRKAAERALEAAGVLDEQQRERLAERARKAREALEELPRDALGPLEDESYDRARQRLVDSEDALQAGDLGEARRMARDGAGDLDRLARDLELSALMFPGAEGRTSRAAKAAREAADRARELRRSLDDALPRVGDYVQQEGQRQMRQDAERQGKAGRAAGELAEKFEQGPDDMPLAPDASERIRQARERMREAGRALRQSDPLEASQAQREAARQLTELREELEKSRRQQQSGGGGGGEGSDGGRADFQRRVRIPGADEHHGPMELRRRLLDAMREQPPSGYESAVERYYRELLR